MLKFFSKFDLILLIAVLLLLGLSLAALYPISYAGNNSGAGETSHFLRQMIFVAIGLALFFVFAFTDYRILRAMSPALFLSGILLLTLVLLLGKTTRGTSGWISLGFFNFQPVELLKLIIIVVLAKYFSLNIKTIRQIRHIFISAVPVFVSVFLVLLQPDLGSSLIIAGAWAGILLLSGVRYDHLAIVLIVGLLVCVLSWSFFLKDYQKERMEVLLNPSSDPLGAGYNALQATVAVGSGGLWGKGLGHGSQSQLNFLPEKHTDFIFALIAEEMGLAGTIFALILLLIVLVRLFVIARDSRENFGKLLVSAAAVIILLQISVNVGMNIGIAPVAGIPLPLLSYGGSSLFVTLAMLGIAESVHWRTRQSMG